MVVVHLSNLLSIVNASNILSSKLVRSVPFKDNFERLEDELEVFGYFSIAADIVVVKAHLPFEGDVAASADLPNAGESRCHGKAHAVPWFVFRNFFRNRWTRTDDRHVSLEDVDELR